MGVEVAVLVVTVGGGGAINDVIYNAINDINVNLNKDINVIIKMLMTISIRMLLYMIFMVFHGAILCVSGLIWVISKI